MRPKNDMKGKKDAMANQSKLFCFMKKNILKKMTIEIYEMIKALVIQDLITTNDEK